VTVPLTLIFVYFKKLAFEICNARQSSSDRRMNRIKIGPLTSQPIVESSSSTKRKSSAPKIGTFVESADCVDLGFASPSQFSIADSCLFVPLHYEQNYRYPLIVWLHSNGDDPQQVHRIMPELSLQNFVAIAPRAAVGNRHAGFHWDQDPDSIAYATDAVIQSIDYAMARTSIAPDRIFIAGYGAAGTMAFRAALTHPDVVTGVASLNGPLPEGDAPLGRWGVSQNPEVFWAHCRKSANFGQEKLCEQLRLLHVAGFSVTLRQYPGGDQLSSTSLSDLNRWIMDTIDTTIA